MAYISSAAITADGAVAGTSTNGGNYYGFSAKETGGSAVASFNIHDGTSNSGPVLEHVTLAPGESAREFYVQGGLKYRTGLYVDVTGAVSVVVRHG